MELEIGNGKLTRGRRGATRFENNVYRHPYGGMCVTRERRVINYPHNHSNEGVESRSRILNMQDNDRCINIL